MHLCHVCTCLSLHIHALKKKGRTQMSTLEHVLPPIVAPSAFSWKRYLLDSLLAFTGAMLVTGVLYLFQLYTRISNISIVYLLVVLALASKRGRYLLR